MEELSILFLNLFTINTFTVAVVINCYKRWTGILLFLFCSLYFLNIYAQTYKVAGLYNGQAAQGMAIYGKHAFLFNNTGICRVFNLKSKKIEREFKLASSGKNHCNSASFGVEKNNGSKFPVIYISQCNAPYKCFVESVTDTNSELVQTICAKKSGKNVIVHDWVVDRKNKALYSITDLSWKKTDKKYTHIITKYNLPRLSEGPLVELTDEDVVECFKIYFPNLMQGASIMDAFLYLPTGRHGNDKSEDAKREVIVVNLKPHAIENKISLMEITEKEPEDCDFYKGSLLVFCGQEGGLYKVLINH